MTHYTKTQKQQKTGRQYKNASDDSVRSTGNLKKEVKYQPKTPLP